MGVKERRNRERQELRHAILEAAREIAATEGWQAVTIRKVAEKIEYSPPTIYEYFPSKEAILGEEMHEGHRLLIADLKAARDAHTDPREKLWAMGRAYWDFVWTHPELYQVISGLGGCAFCQDDTSFELHQKSEGENVMVLFRDVLQAVLPRVQNVEDLTSKCIVLWSLFHGFITLIMSSRIPMDQRDHAYSLASQTVGDLLTVWQVA
jgi:AcrR family transcriptional regulator